MRSGLNRFLARTGWDRTVFYGGIAVMVLAAWAFVELADDAPEGDYLAWETRVLRQLRGGGEEPGGPAWLPWLAKGITHLGGTPVLIVVGAGALAWLAARNRRRSAAILLGTILGGHALNLILKHAFARARPDAVIHLVETNSPSFPSGHSMAATIHYLAIAVLLARHVKRRRHQAALLAGAFVVIFAVGLSRVYLGVHYPTDVAAGWTAGTAWAVAASFLAAWRDPTPRGPDT